MSAKPVVVYGASGYTGRLVCEYLREHNLPFIAAGRSKDRLASAMERNVPGIETADYEIAEVDHSLDSLTKLFTGAKVVINTVGPFAQYGHETVQACLAAGCHYTDTTGEQDWMIACDEKYGAEFAGRPAAPPASPRCTRPVRSRPTSPSRSPGLDTLDISVFWKGVPTVASTATILVNAALARPTTSSRTSTSSGRPTAASTRSPSPASTRSAWPCPGAARRTPSGSSATRGSPTSRSSAGSSTAR